MDTELPAVFDPHPETNKILKKAKESISKKFSWTKADPLWDTKRLAYLLIVFGREDEALQVCRFLGQMEFKGFRTWSPVEKTLALESRILRSQGEKKLAQACIDRIRAAGFVDERLEGSMLDPNHGLEVALEEADNKKEFEARVRRASEIAFIIELGGSNKCPVKQMEQEWSENLKRLQELAGV